MQDPDLRLHDLTACVSGVSLVQVVKVVRAQQIIADRMIPDPANRTVMCFQPPAGDPWAKPTREQTAACFAAYEELLQAVRQE